MSQKLLLEIERLRNELNKALDENALRLDKDKVMDLSLKLDKLILEYINEV